VIAGVVIGVVGLPSFNYVLSATSSDEFCAKCHANDVSQEVVGTPHYTNTSGFHATCADCHLPREYFPYVYKKTKQGVKDAIGTIRGVHSTPEKFEANRMAMAIRVWEEMNADDSKNCRYCHVEEKWDLAAQTDKARDFHTSSGQNGKTCIDCHKGLAHQLPEGITEDEQIEGMDF
jgi:cytochrome c-type protein NapC